MIDYDEDMKSSTCLFCDKDNTASNTIIVENKLAYARWDNFPVNPGHAEIVPIRHVESYFDLTDSEVLAMYDLIKQVKDTVTIASRPDGFNIGINDGEAAGRTIHHLHMHLIPRFKGDVPNPRGGVRYVVPEKGNY